MSMTIQNTEAWKELRKRKIGASDAPIIMNVSPWSTPYKLWAQKVGIEGDTYINQAMQRGIDREEEARHAFTAKTNIKVYPKVVFHDQYDWMMASLDGIDENQENIVEIKNAGYEDHSVAVKGKVPKKYYPQLQHQLEVTGLDKAFYFSYHNGQGAVVEIGRDEKYISEMLDEEKKFFVCMQDFIAPKMTERDYVSLDDEELKHMADEYLELQKQLALMVKREEALKAQLIDACEARNYNNAVCQGVQLSRCVRKGNIDYSKIPELKRIDLEIFRKEPTKYWRVTRTKT